MAKLLKGNEVAAEIIQRCAAHVSERITNGGTAPKLAIIEVGQDASNASYLKGIHKKAAEAGVLCDFVHLDKTSTQKKLLALVSSLNDDNNVDGILLLRPLPKNCDLNERAICETILPDKDVDSANSNSLASTYTGNPGYAPCTAEACMKILHHNNIEVAGKRVVVLGRSLVVGKPVANMLQNENATVTVCHSKTQDIASFTCNADIVIVATGTPKQFDASYFSKEQVVVDAGINWDSMTNKLCGDVDFDSVKDIVSAITPVPGGVGSVTSAVLIEHVVF